MLTKVFCLRAGGKIMSYGPSLAAGHRETAGDLQFDDVPSFLMRHTVPFLCVCLCAQFLTMPNILD